MIIQGDCLIEMRKMKPNSIDTIITDPPYGLEFMGKEWDAPWKGKASKEFNTSCEGKLGGFKKLPNYTRGNNTKCLNCGKWKFSSNPCKCNNPKFPHTQQLAMIKYQEWMTEIAKEMLRVTKPGGTLLIFGGTRTYHRLACAIEDAGWILKDCIMWLYGSGFPKALDIGKKVKEFEGWKSHGLKPAYEPILVAMKPNEGTYAQNALKWGVSGLWIDGARIEGDMGKDRALSTPRRTDNTKYGKANETINPQSPLGRFPANIILDEKASRLLDEQSGERTGAHGGKSCGYDWFKGGNEGRKINKSQGGASRFFKVIK